MKTITASVVWSAGVRVEVSDKATVEEKQEAIRREAVKAEIDRQHFIIHECSDPDCID